jgi:hypothetical protein
MLPGADSPVARVRGIGPVNSQQPAIHDHPIDSFCNPPTAARFFYGAPLNEGMAEHCSLDPRHTDADPPGPPDLVPQRSYGMSVYLNNRLE